jgi:hypothetical protein
MSLRREWRLRTSVRVGLPLWVLTIAMILSASVASAGGVGGRVSAVGGVAIDAAGVVAKPTAEEAKLYRDMVIKAAQPVAPELNQPVELRKISLKAIEEAVAKSDLDTTYEMPEEIRFLAGIQRIQYILVYPENGDIVLAGPGEGWKVDEAGNHIGVTTGRPVLRLEDLVVALRTVHNAREGGITVSIDPTEEGRRRYNQLQRNISKVTPEVLRSIEKAFGPQQITIQGVPDSSRFARMLFASDYHMKRIAMKLDPSPIKALPSYVEMIQRDRAKVTNAMPRWWLACNYEPIGKSADGMAFEIRGAGVKVMTEDELIGADGSIAGTGKTSPTAQKWADLMTAKYDELSVQQPVFGELRNMMDLAVVAALITKEDLLAKANLEVPTLTKTDGKLGITHWHAPKTIATQCSALRGNGEVIVTASGGVEITSWQVADRVAESATAGEVRAKSAKTGSLWWN